MVTGTVVNLARTHTVMKYGDRNITETCRHTYSKAQWWQEI